MDSAAPSEPLATLGDNTLWLACKWLRSIRKSDHRNKQQPRRAAGWLHHQGRSDKDDRLE